MLVVGTALMLGGVSLYAWSLKALLPAFREQFSEFTPGALVVSGPYRYTRHPIYLSSLVILAGLDLALGAAFSTLLLPVGYMLFKLITLYEERVILVPKFPQAYAQYRRRVRAGMLGRTGGALAGLVYLGLAAITLLETTGVYDFGFVR